MKKDGNLRPWLVIGLATLLTLGLANAVVAEDGSVSEPPTESVDEAPAVSDGNFTPVTFAGMQVFVDQETGRMRAPTAEESQELAARMRTLFQEKRTIHRPRANQNGMTSLVIAPSHLNFTVAVVKEDGSLETDCVTDPEEGLERLEQTAAGEPR